MATTSTATTNFSDLVTQLVAARALEELRARAVHAMPGMYVPARFVKGTNTLRYARYADLGVVTSTLSEGVAPTDQALTISSEFFTAVQYGATVAVTDLAQIDNPHDLIGIAAEKASVVSFVIEGVTAMDAGMFLDTKGIAVRTGYHCTEPVMHFFKIPGTIRASFMFYNTKEEIDALAENLTKAIALLQTHSVA